MHHRLQSLLPIEANSSVALPLIRILQQIILVHALYQLLDVIVVGKLVCRLLPLTIFLLFFLSFFFPIITTYRSRLCRLLGRLLTALLGPILEAYIPIFGALLGPFRRCIALASRGRVNACGYLPDEICLVPMSHHADLGSLQGKKALDCDGLDGFASVDSLLWG